MANEAKEADEADTEVAAPKPPLLPLLVGIVNTLVILAAIGMLVYTRLIYQRPKITEEGERARIEQMKASPAAPAAPGFVNFDPITINIAPSPPDIRPADGNNPQMAGKLHYATIGFSIEISDTARKDELDALKPLILDQFLALVGHKQFHELTSVQGRYVLKTQLIELANTLAAKRIKLTQPDKAQDEPSPLIIDLFFNQFIVQ